LSIKQIKYICDYIRKSKSRKRAKISKRATIKGKRIKSEIIKREKRKREIRK